MRSPGNQGPTYNVGRVTRDGHVGLARSRKRSAMDFTAVPTTSNDSLNLRRPRKGMAAHAGHFVVRAFQIPVFLERPKKVRSSPIIALSI
jgi:hypothetical protein